MLALGLFLIVVIPSYAWVLITGYLINRADKQNSEDWK